MEFIFPQNNTQKVISKFYSEKISIMSSCNNNSYYCGGKGTDSTIPTNTVQVPITTGTVTDSGSEYTGFIGVISGYIYKIGEL